jgi:hypothetical protein
MLHKALCWLCCMNAVLSAIWRCLIMEVLSFDTALLEQSVCVWPPAACHWATARHEDLNLLILG